MKPAAEREAPRGPKQPTQLPSTEISSSSVFGFPIAVNQFQLLQESKPAVSQKSEQNEEQLLDPRRTRLLRQPAARETEERGTLYDEGIIDSVPPVKDA